jgi:rhodanese-related sulfurtransferase
LLLHNGVTRVRPLEGGFDAWRERGFPVEPVESVTVTQISS